MRRLLQRCAGVVFVADRVLIVLAMVVFSAAVAQQQGQPGQATAPPAAGRGNFGDNFTGKITVGNTTDMRSSRIRFEAGARTNWHIHSAAQLLLVEEGRGRLHELGSEIKDLLPGQPVLTRPNVLHWHGAAPDQPAVQFSVYTGTLEWKQPVSDDEYLGKKAGSR
jgi:quercetin dioxygenase-like cupin family protein